ncbi:MAG: hypothetical protein HXX80_06255 [Nitrososphaerales archaeon]|nr:hypothetical protein [Nitrososphaerales archaeon]
MNQDNPPESTNSKGIGGARPHQKGFFGRSAKKASITIDGAIAILGARLKWCDGRIDLYEDEEDKKLKYLDNLSKIAGPLMQAFKLRGIEVKDEQDLAKIFEEIAKRREGKKIVRIFIE